MSKRISNEELISELERINDIIPDNKSPRRKDMKDMGEYSAGTYTNRFGGWNEGLKEAGFELNKKDTGYPKKIAEEELIFELQRLDSSIDRNLQMEDMRKRGKYTFDTYQKRFGSWNKALKEAGIEINREVNISIEDIVKDIKNVSEKHCNGGSPTSVDMKNHGKYSERIYLFNSDISWVELLKTAGFESKYQVTEEQLITAIHDLAEDIGKTPSSRDMKREGKYTSCPYRRVFGTWKKALLNAGYEPIGYVSGEDHPSWKGGVKHEERRKRENWSKRVKNRDNYECQRCEEARSEVRFAHHIKRKDQYPNLAFDDSNGITLCADCHAQAHKNDREYNSLKALADELARKDYKMVYSNE